MGEYAARKSDGESIKIGTCEVMSALRYEDRCKVSRELNSLDPATTLNLFWRLPFPDEDTVPIGDYQDWNRGYRLGKQAKEPDGWNGWMDFKDESLAETPGRIQLRHEASGLTVNIVCYHGIKLPEDSESAKFAWNGKGYSIELIHVKNTAEGVKPVIQCRHCRKLWRCEWDEILDWIDDKELRNRLEKHQ